MQRLLDVAFFGPKQTLNTFNNFKRPASISGMLTTKKELRILRLCGTVHYCAAYSHLIQSQAYKSK